MKLHHGSKYNHTELKPGYERVGKTINWDQTESNEYLYATVSKEAAIGMSLASTVEQSYLLDRFQHHDRIIRITVSEGPLPTVEDLLKLKTYVYAIRFDPRDGWEKVNNQYNNMSGEYKTKKTLKSSIEQVFIIEMEKWLKDKQVIILGPEDK
jgi:hypothetical protein